MLSRLGIIVEYPCFLKEIFEYHLYTMHVTIDTEMSSNNSAFMDLVL